MLKRDSGAPFTLHVTIEAEPPPPPPPLPSEAEGAEMKEGLKNSVRWSASRRFLRTSSKRAKVTGNEEERERYSRGEGHRCCYPAAQRVEGAEEAKVVAVSHFVAAHSLCDASSYSPHHVPFYRP
jgi:hypothetical protein